MERSSIHSYSADSFTVDRSGGHWMYLYSALSQFLSSFKNFTTTCTATKFQFKKQLTQMLLQSGWLLWWCPANDVGHLDYFRNI